MAVPYWKAELFKGSPLNLLRSGVVDLNDTTTWYLRREAEAKCVEASPDHNELSYSFRKNLAGNRLDVSFPD